MCINLHVLTPRREPWFAETYHYSVVAYVERVLDDAADQLRREEVGEFRGEGCDDGVEVGALVFIEAARGADLSEVHVVQP